MSEAQQRLVRAGGGGDSVQQQEREEMGLGDEGLLGMLTEAAGSGVLCMCLLVTVHMHMHVCSVFGCVGEGEGAIMLS
jgi:hypothetical protein